MCVRARACVCARARVRVCPHSWPRQYVRVNRYRYLLTKKAVTLAAVAESDIRLVRVYWTSMTNAVIFRICVLQ